MHIAAGGFTQLAKLLVAKSSEDVHPLVVGILDQFGVGEAHVEDSSGSTLRARLGATRGGSFGCFG